jgi:hypothetical protein
MPHKCPPPPHPPTLSPPSCSPPSQPAPAPASPTQPLPPPLPHNNRTLLPVLFSLENGAVVSVRGNVYPGITLSELKTLAYLVTRPHSAAHSEVAALTTAPATPLGDSDDIAVDDGSSHPTGLAIETDEDVARLVEAAAARGEPPRFRALQQPFSHPHVDTTSLEHAFQKNWASVIACYLSTPPECSSLPAHVVQQAFGSGTPNVEVLELLLERGLNMNAYLWNREREDKDVEVSLLTLAVEASARSKDLRPVRVMLERGADPNHPRRGAYIPLRAAAVCGSDDAARLLVDHGAELNKYDPYHGDILYTAVRQVAHGLPIGLVRTLLAAGANPNAENYNGHRPQDYIRRVVVIDQAMSTRDRGKRLELVTVLLEAGASASVADPFMGWPPLHTAADQDDEDLVRLLLKYGAHVNAPMSDGRTVLRMMREKWNRGKNGGQGGGQNAEGVATPPVPEVENEATRIIRMLEAKGARG